MPAYLARVQGENFQFFFDDEPQKLNFTRTVYVESDSVSSAETIALEVVEQQLRQNALWNEAGEQLISIDALEPYDNPVSLSLDNDFFWYFGENN